MSRGVVRQKSEGASYRFETMEAARKEAATSTPGLTKSAPATAKKQGASMADTKDRPALRPDDPKHGTTTGYRDGCRQPCCRRAVANAAAARRARQYLQRTEKLSVSSLGTRRRIQALVALGWSLAQISREAGYHRSHSGLLLDRSDNIHAATADRYRDVYDRLSMTLPPANTKEERINASRSRGLARRNGWVPPLAWNNIDTDLTHEMDEPDRPTDPIVDEVKVQRVLNGWTQDCNTPERYAVIERWEGSLSELERVTGWNVFRMLKREAA